jgi:hypothetical protein
MIADDLKPEHEPEFKTSFMSQVENSVHGIREQQRISDAISSRIAQMFKPAPDDDDDAPTKH